MAKSRSATTALAVILVVASIELVRTAWISDDAAITIRSVLNFINGYGARFNIDERVQTFTHPMWFLVLSAASLLTRNVFTATFVLSIGISLVVLWLLVTRVATTLAGGILAASALLLSKAYVDFSTSGLENPLAHLAIVLAVIAAAAAHARPGAAMAAGFFLSCSLLYLTRPDLVLLAVPMVWLIAMKYRENPRVLIKAIAIGALPAVAWTIFSLYYYGFPFPNTAYAKLGTGIPLNERIVQGGVYLLDSVRRDPLTLAAIGVVAILAVRSSSVDAALAGGSILYLAYVVSIGGDFMTGRFLTPPLVTAAAVIARSGLSTRQLTLAAAAVAILAVPAIHSTLLSRADFSDSNIPENGIADERAYYFQRYGLIAAPGGTFAAPVWTLRPRSVLVMCASLGFTGIAEGPGAHLIDVCALADPLLARLPAERTRRWRPGHFTRQLPTDYEESVLQNANLLADPLTRSYYASLRIITRGRLNSRARLREIVRMNLGDVPKPDFDMYHHTKVPRSSRSGT